MMMMMMMNIHGFIGCLNIYNYIGWLNIYGTHVTANNSTNNNGVFFIGFRFENSILKQELILDNNALDKRGKIFCASTYLETKSFKTVPK